MLPPDVATFRFHPDPDPSVEPGTAHALAMRVARCRRRVGAGWALVLGASDVDFVLAVARNVPTAVLDSSRSALRRARRLLPEGVHFLVDDPREGHVDVPVAVAVARSTPWRAMTRADDRRRVARSLLETLAFPGGTLCVELEVPPVGAADPWEVPSAAANVPLTTASVEDLRDEIVAVVKGRPGRVVTAENERFPHVVHVLAG